MMKVKDGIIRILLTMVLALLIGAMFILRRFSKSKNNG